LSSIANSGLLSILGLWYFCT